MAPRTWLLPLLATALLVPAHARADEPLPGFNAAAVLMNPHASAPEKCAACRELAAIGHVAPIALFALARQSRYDQPYVRELALDTLIKLAGEHEANRYRAMVTPANDNNRAIVQWLDAVNTWQDVPPVVLALRSANPGLRGAAVSAIIKLWEDQPALPPGFESKLDEPLRDQLTTDLAERFPHAEIGNRASILRLVNALNPGRPAAVSLIFQALDDDAHPIRFLGQNLADRLFTSDFNDPRLVGALVSAATFRDPREANDDARRTRNAAFRSRAADRLAALGPRARPAATDFALGELADGKPAADDLLKSWHAADTPLAAVARGVSSEPAYLRQAARELFQSLALDPAHASDTALEGLSDDDPVLSSFAARVAAADPARLDPAKLFAAAVADDHLPSPQATKELNLDPAVVGRALAPFVARNGEPQQAVALQTLLLVGLKGPEIRPALTPLLESDNDETRIAAAELLDRQDVIARTRIPALLRDLRSDDLSRRTNAAHQLDALGVEPKEITTTLLRAVTNRNMPVREGLILALERAQAKHQNSLDTLKQLAAPDNPDPAPRAYARAALREVLASTK